MKQELKDFLKIIFYLKDAYINFDFDIFDKDKPSEPSSRLNLWYNMLKHIDNKTLEYVVYDYIKSNIYPPSSPASLLEHYRKIYKDYLPKASEMFDYCIQLWRVNYKWDYNKTLKHLESENKVLYKAFSQIRSKLYVNAYETETTANIETWARKEFIQHYEEYKEVETQEISKNGKSLFMIENNEVKLLK